MSDDQKLPSPTTEIRTDLWPTMTSNQLKNQQDLLLNKIELVATMMGPLSPPHIQQLYRSLQLAYSELTNLINTKPI